LNVQWLCHDWNSDENNKKEKLGYKLLSLEKTLQLLDTIGASVCENSERMSYWDMLAEINISLCKYLIQFSVKSEKGEPESIQNEEIHKDIIDLWKNAGSKGKRFAEIEHLEFIIDALSISNNKNTKALSAKLEQLKKELVKQIEL